MKKLNKRSIYLFLTTLSVCLLLCSSCIQKEKQYPTGFPVIHENSLQVKNIQLLAWYKKFYMDNGSVTPASFNKDHVTPATLRDYLEKTDDGYVIQLPGSTLVPSPVIYNGIIFVSGGFGSKQYYSFKGKSGELIGAWDLDDDGPSSAAIKDSILVFNTESCTIFAIDLRTEEQLWSWWLGDPLMSMPTISNRIVFTAYPAGSIPDHAGAYRLANVGRQSRAN